MEDSLSNCMEPFALSLWTEAAPVRLGAMIGGRMKPA